MDVLIAGNMKYASMVLMLLQSGFFCRSSIFYPYGIQKNMWYNNRNLTQWVYRAVFAIAIFLDFQRRIEEVEQSRYELNIPFRKNTAEIIVFAFHLFALFSREFDEKQTQAMFYSDKLRLQ